MVFEERSWVRIIIEDRVVEEGIVGPGETLEFSHPEEISIRLGNAGGVVLQLNDRSLGSPAGRGDVWQGVCTPEDCVGT
jgi:cytoskeleton protein RodZ